MKREKNDKPKLSWRMQQFIKTPWKSRLRAQRISAQEILSEEFMDKYNGYLFWEDLCQHQEMSEKFIEDHINRIYPIPLLNRGLIGESFIRKYAFDINWKTISNSYAHLSTEFLREFKDRIDWNRYFNYHVPTEKFIEEFKDVVPWSYVPGRVKMSENFIRRHRLEMEKYYAFWTNICEHQDLSEEFIEEFAEKVDWKAVSYKQKLSKEMMHKYADKLEWRYIISNQNIDQKFVEEHIDYILPLSPWQWTDMIKHIKFGRRFLRKYKNKIRWVEMQMLYERIAYNIEHNIKSSFIECATIVPKEFVEEMKKKAGYYN